MDEIARRPFSIPISCYLKLNFDGLLARIWEMMVRSQEDQRFFESHAWGCIDRLSLGLACQSNVLAHIEDMAAG